MNTIEYHDEDLQQLFRQLPFEKPSAGFTARVMTQVAFEKQRAARLKRLRLIAWVVSMPCVTAVLLIAGYYTRNFWEVYLWSYFEALFIPLKYTFSSIKEIFAGVGKSVVMPGVSFLVLLVGDLFFRTYMERKKNLSSVIE